MSRHLLDVVVLIGTLGWASSAHGVDFFWTGPGLGGPGGNFRTAQNWTFTPPPFPLLAAPGGADDTANFDRGRHPEDRYTVTNVNGVNDRLLIRDDSVRLQIGDYQLLSTDEGNPSFVVGAAGGDEADVILQGVGDATLRTEHAVIGLGVASEGEVTVDRVQWEVDGPLSVGGVSGGGGNGTLTIQNGSLVTSETGGIARAPGSISEVHVSDSRWTVDEELTVGSNNGSGVLTIQGGGVVTSGFGRVVDNSTATVDGPGSAWTITGGLAMFQDVNSTLNISNGGAVTVGLNEFNTMTANSSTEISLDSGGVLDVRTSIVMNNGTFDFLGGTLHVGEFDGNLVNQGGALAPGNPDEPVGSTNVTGSYTHQSAAMLQIEIGGTAAGTQHDFANVEGTALIAGALGLTLINGFAPAADDEFVVFSVDTLLLGAFGNVADGQRLATSDGGGSFVVRYGPTSTFNANQVVLTNFLFSADFDEDGDVDGNDLTRWRNNFGTGTTHMTGDADGDGDADGSDFLVWQQQLGSVPAVAAAGAVPEPSGWTLVALSLLGGALGRRRC